MNYNFMVNGEKIRTWYNNLVPVITEYHDKGIVGFIEIYQKNGKSKRTPVYSKENPYFVYAGKNVFMKDFLAYSPEEIVENIIKNENDISPDDLCNTLEKYGMDALHLIIRTKACDVLNFGNAKLYVRCESPMDDKSKWHMVEYEFVPEYLRMPVDGYKLKLKPVSTEIHYPTEDFYVGDLIGLLADCKEDYQLVAVN